MNPPVSDRLAPLEWTLPAFLTTPDHSQILQHPEKNAGWQLGIAWRRAVKRSSEETGEVFIGGGGGCLLFVSAFGFGPGC